MEKNHQMDTGLVKGFDMDSYQHYGFRFLLKL